MDPNEAAKGWMEEFSKLPKKRQLAIQDWQKSQLFMARELGLQMDHWMIYVQWAFAHPFDYAFISSFPELKEKFDQYKISFSHQEQKNHALLGQRAPRFERPSSTPNNSFLELMVSKDKVPEE